MALTTGLYMMGLGLGSVVMSPTAILFGKRPVYLATAMAFSVTCVWCALSPNYLSLLLARIVQGVSISPVECLPSASIAEIYFLHERAYRLGIYTLLLLGGKNLVPLGSAAVIQSLSWRWVFWITAMIGALCFFLLLFFVPETFWDRTPKPHKTRRRKSTGLHSKAPIVNPVTSVATAEKSRPSVGNGPTLPPNYEEKARLPAHDGTAESCSPIMTVTAPPSSPQSLKLSPTGGLAQRRAHKNLHVGFAASLSLPQNTLASIAQPITRLDGSEEHSRPEVSNQPTPAVQSRPQPFSPAWSTGWDRVDPKPGAPRTPALSSFNSPSYNARREQSSDYFDRLVGPAVKAEESRIGTTPDHPSPLPRNERMTRYTSFYRGAPPKSFLQSLKPFSGRLSYENWFRVAFRPFVLFAYPAVLWSSVVYALSVGWLIVLSESVAEIYRSRETYNFSALGVGLVYISPFVGGVLGTAVAGKISDSIVMHMSRRNRGVYEPEFRLVMAIPVAITTTMGLIGYGWSAEEKDRWIVPTVFFGIISFGCCLGSATAITFCVDSYRQYAGEALVTLNFSKSKSIALERVGGVTDGLQTSSTASSSPFSSTTGSRRTVRKPSFWDWARSRWAVYSSPRPCTSSAKEPGCGR